MGAVLATTPVPAGAVPTGGGRVDADGVVRQSTPSTCAAAAAATLLRALGIDPDAREQRLARLCLTDPRRGTRDLGLYRGLRRAAPGHGVRFARLDEVDLRARDRACIVYVGLEAGRVRDPELFAVLRDECGWTPGDLHAVVLLGFDGGSAAVVADPRTGRERCGITHWRALYSGRAVLVESA